MTRSKGFTLIELLIVVAIIAILAAIAVPNFLEAQVRSKVSRVKSDMRAVATGLESYAVDYNRLPAPMDVHNATSWPGNSLGTPPFHARVPSSITTPIAYMTSIPADPFRSTKQVLTGALAEYNTRFTYFSFPFFRSAFGDTGFENITTFSDAEEIAGAWLMYSVGPDADEFNEGGAQDVYVDYDPTNGTVSVGNVFRTQASGEGLGIPEFLR